MMPKKNEHQQEGRDPHWHQQQQQRRPHVLVAFSTSEVVEHCATQVWQGLQG
jgi:hypothetical protein